MSELLSEAQMRRIEPNFPLSHRLPDARELIGDKGYDGGWFRSVTAARGTAACNPSKHNRKVHIPHDHALSIAPQDRGQVRQAQGLACIHTR